MPTPPREPQSKDEQDAEEFMLIEEDSHLGVPDDAALRVETALEQVVHDRGPAGWWRLGMVALAAVALVLLIAQIISGGPPKVPVPASAPVTTAPAK
ncbi:MAG: hypothetical protein JWN11_1552 [Hyphomicrobiales bacterium]|jgi:hypothetical protein|nr:hypothetical protein [Hyphomicrobiales bacterium]